MLLYLTKTDHLNYGSNGFIGQRQENKNIVGNGNFNMTVESSGVQRMIQAYNLDNLSKGLLFPVQQPKPNKCHFNKSKKYI